MSQNSLKVAWNLPIFSEKLLVNLMKNDILQMYECVISFVFTQNQSAATEVLNRDDVSITTVSFFFLQLDRPLV